MLNDTEFLLSDQSAQKAEEGLGWLIVIDWPTTESAREAALAPSL
ncbi:MAG: hypothetical protein NTY84_14705 [Verrucomicrobia bacterium]|nr:hypothetical protein [Verrucomicrobiota bacterium]